MHLNNSVAVDLPARLNFRLRSGTGTCCPRAVTEPYPTLEQVESFSKKVQWDDSGESWWFGRWRVEGVEGVEDWIFLPLARRQFSVCEPWHFSVAYKNACTIKLCSWPNSTLPSKVLMSFIPTNRYSIFSLLYILCELFNSIQESCFVLYGILLLRVCINP